MSVISNFPSSFISNNIFPPVKEVGFVLKLNSCGSTLHNISFSYNVWVYLNSSSNPEDPLLFKILEK